jgi:class 3 adenylate cyclase
MAADSEGDSQLEIGHVLFLDIVGYSKLLTNEQRERQRELNRVVRGTEQFRAAETAGKLVRIPTGDGMVLAFFTSPDAPVRCAVAISRALRGRNDLPLRMGIHSGPVDLVEDVNDKPNLAGAGVNIAQRVMNCGDAGHILLSAPRPMTSPNTRSGRRSCTKSVKRR